MADSATGPARILVVEDDPLSAQMMRAIMRRMEAETDVVSTGEAALQAFRDRRHGLLFIDIRLPDIDGISLVRKLRAHEARSIASAGGEDWPRALMIGVSASVLAPMHRECLTAGMDDIIAKPVSVDRIRQFVAAHGRGHASAAGGTPLRHEYWDMARVISLRDVKTPAGSLWDSSLTEFRRYAPEALGELRDLAGTTDGEAFLERLHRFKGSCDSIGACKLSHHCGELPDRLGESGNRDRRSAVHQLQTILEESLAFAP